MKEILTLEWFLSVIVAGTFVSFVGSILYNRSLKWYDSFTNKNRLRSIRKLRREAIFLRRMKTNPILISYFSSRNIENILVSSTVSIILMLISFKFLDFVLLANELIDGSDPFFKFMFYGLGEMSHEGRIFLFSGISGFSMILSVVLFLRIVTASRVRVLIDRAARHLSENQ